jgi:hypothetical protein
MPIALAAAARDSPTSPQCSWFSNRTSRNTGLDVGPPPQVRKLQHFVYQSASRPQQPTGIVAKNDKTHLNSDLPEVLAEQKLGYDQYEC